MANAILNSGDIRRLAEALRITSHFEFPATFPTAAGLLAETAARIAGDAALSAAIAAEAATRAAADTALQNQITALQQPTYAPQMLLGGM